MASTQSTLQANTPLNVVECEPTELNFTGGTPPYIITILSAADLNGPPLDNFGATEGTGLAWVVDLPAGANYIFSVRDAAGALSLSAPFPILQGTSNSCLAANTAFIAATSRGALTSASGTLGPSTTSSPTRTSTQLEPSTGNPASSGPPSSGGASPTTSAPPSPSDSIHRVSPSAGIYAGIFGGIIGLLIILAIGILWRRRRRRYRERVRVPIDDESNVRPEPDSMTGSGSGSDSVTAGIKQVPPPNSFTDVQEWTPASLFVADPPPVPEKSEVRPSTIASSLPDTLETATARPSTVASSQPFAPETTSAPTSVPAMSPEQAALLQSLIDSNAPREAVASVIQMVTGGAVAGGSNDAPPPQYSAER